MAGNADSADDIAEAFDMADTAGTVNTPMAILSAQSTPLWRFSRHSRRPCGDSVDTANISYAAVSAETADITESKTAGTADDVAHNIHIFMLIPGRFLLRRQTMNIFSGHRRHSGDSIDAAVATNADRRRLVPGQ